MAATLVVGATLALGGCTPGPTLAESGTSPIFDRARTTTDELPSDPSGSVDVDTSRYVGEDSAGNKYWAAYETNSASECIVFVPSDGDDGFIFCGGPGVSGTTGSGLIVEFASSPNHLTVDEAELVGDTLLVKQPS